MPHHIRRLGAATASAALLTMLYPVGPAQAEKPSAGCPGKFQQSVFPLNYQLGDPIDPDGLNLLVQLGIAGTIEEFGSLEAGLDAFGFDTFDAFYAAVVDPVYNRFDRNDDGILCFKPYPSQSNLPAYLFNTIDNTASS